jgi:hypothetical protein
MGLQKGKNHQIVGRAKILWPAELDEMEAI